MLRFCIVFLSFAAFLGVSHATLSEVKKIVWEDCGGDAASVRFRSFEMSVPKMSGPLNFYIDATADEPLDTITIETRFSWELWWFGGSRMDFPCVNNLGSCVYDDVCDRLAFMKSQNGNVCSQEMQNVGLVTNCTCPLQPGRAQGYFSVNMPPMPAEFKQVQTGVWTIELSLQNQANQEVGCTSCTIDWDSINQSNGNM